MTKKEFNNERFLVFSILFSICAIMLMSSISIAEEVWQYKLYDYYYDSNGNEVNGGTTVTGEKDDDVATHRMVTKRYHVQRSDGNWEVMVGSAHRYEKDDDGKWQLRSGIWYEWAYIYDWIINGGSN